MKLKYKQLMVQITRQCNLKCAHCAKGEAEALTLKKEYIDEALKQIGQIDTLSLVGGEPFLEPQIIKYLVEQIKAQKKKPFPLRQVSKCPSRTRPKRLVVQVSITIIYHMIILLSIVAICRSVQKYHYE